MLDKISMDEFEDGDEFPETEDGLESLKALATAEGLELAEALAAEENDGEEVNSEQVRAKEMWGAGESLSAIARELFEVNRPSRFHFNKVRELLGSASATNGTVKAVAKDAKPKRAYTRRKKPGETGAPHANQPGPLAADYNGNHALASTSGNGHGQPLTLTANQVAKIWELMIGGKLTITGDSAGRVVCEVDEAGMRAVMPALIDRL